MGSRLCNRWSKITISPFTIQEHTCIYMTRPEKCDHAIFLAQSPLLLIYKCVCVSVCVSSSLLFSHVRLSPFIQMVESIHFVLLLGVFSLTVMMKGMYRSRLPFSHLLFIDFAKVPVFYYAAFYYASTVYNLQVIFLEMLKDAITSLSMSFCFIYNSVKSHCPLLKKRVLARETQA